MTANLVISVRELTKRISDLEKKIVSLDPEQLALKPKHKPLTSREVCQLIHKYGYIVSYGCTGRNTIFQTGENSRIL